MSSERSNIILNSPRVRFATGKIWDTNWSGEGFTTIKAPSFKSSLILVLVIAREPAEKCLGEKGGWIGGDVNCNL